MKRVQNLCVHRPTRRRCISVTWAYYNTMERIPADIMKQSVLCTTRQPKLDTKHALGHKSEKKECCSKSGGGGGGQLSLHCFTLLSTNTYLAVTICDRSGMFSGKLLRNVATELRDSWDRKDLSLPLAPKLPILPELSEPFRRSVEGTLPLSDDSTSSVKN